VSNNTIINGTVSINSSLYVSGSLSMNTGTINSNLYVNNNTLINNNITILSSLLISNTSILNNTTTINNSLNVSGNTTINGNITLGNTLTNLNILGKIIGNLPEYSDNTSAISNGVPLWGWYRTGGIIKIRLSDQPPILNLSGSSTINITSGNTFNDPGVYAYDNIDGILVPYLTSINNTSTSNIIINQIPITGTTLITNTTILPIGNYIITYNAINTSSNYQNIYRNLIVN
jgi:hypothetical protein